MCVSGYLLQFSDASEDSSFHEIWGLPWSLRMSSSQHEQVVSEWLEQNLEYFGDLLIYKSIALCFTSLHLDEVIISSFV